MGSEETLLIGTKLPATPRIQAQDARERDSDGLPESGLLGGNSRVIHYQMPYELLFLMHVFLLFYRSCFTLLYGVAKLRNCPF